MYSLDIDYAFYSLRDTNAYGGRSTWTIFVYLISTGVIFVSFLGNAAYLSDMSSAGYLPLNLFERINSESCVLVTGPWLGSLSNWCRESENHSVSDRCSLLYEKLSEQCMVINKPKPFCAFLFAAAIDFPIPIVTFFLYACICCVLP